MTIDLVYTALPPTPNAIGEHTALLASALADHATVRVWTADAEPEPVPGVTVRPLAFSVEGPKGVRRLVDALASSTADWLLLQYNPFSYGKWGFNPYLPGVVRAVRKARPSMIVHEVAPPWLNWRLMLMSSWQFALLAGLARRAEVIFPAIDYWAAAFRSRFPRARVAPVPVGSNIPYVGAGYAEARAALAIPDEACVLGVFGTAHPTRLLPLIGEAVAAERRAGAPVRVLYVGPHGEAVRAAMPDVPFHDAGRLPGPEVSRHLSAMDVYLSPFRNGVSARRGSFLAAVQHGVASVSTHGRHTDAFLRAANGEAFLLAPEGDADAFVAAVRTLVHEPERRARIAKAARTLYLKHCDWPVLAEKMIAHLQAVDAGEELTITNP